MKSINSSIAYLNEAVNNDRLVLFVGAGISVDSGLPTWSDLIKELKKYLDLHEDESDALKIAQILYNEKGEKEYNEIVNNTIFKNSTRANLLHEELFKLNPQHIVTTNYDYFLEEIIEKEGLPYSVISKDIDLPYAKHKRLLIKYHGDFKNHNVVFKETDYLEFSRNNVLKETFVKSLFSNKVILFLGYSYGDINLKLIVREVQVLLQKHHQRAYIYFHKQIEPSAIRYFENLGINVICGLKPDTTLDSDLISSQLSNIGKNVYSFINQINSVNVFDYYNSLDVSNKEDLISNIYKSFKRYDSFLILPRKTIERIFNPKNDSEYYHHDGELIFNCPNDKIYGIFKDYFENDNVDDKLNYILGYIKRAGFNKIAECKINNHGQWVPIKDSILNIIIKHSSKTCECIDCTLESNNYSKIINELDKYILSNDSDLKTDLAYANALFRIAKFYNSYKAYKFVVQKANVLKKFEIGFLAKFNLKVISRYVLITNTPALSNEELKIIQQEGDKINLDNELDKAKYLLDNDLFIFLKELKEGLHIQRICNSIDNDYRKLNDNLENIKRGGSGGKGFLEIILNMQILDDYINRNYIINKNITDTQVYFDKGIDILFMGYAQKLIKTSDTENFRMFGINYINNLNSPLLQLVIDRANPSLLKKAIVRYELVDKRIESGDNEICSYINNLLLSPLTESYFGKEKDQSFAELYNLNSSFKTIINNKFKNICVVLTYINIEKEHLIKTVQNVLTFLENVNNQHGLLDYLPDLIYFHKTTLPRDLIIKMIDVVFNKTGFDSNYFHLIDIIKEMEPTFKIDKTEVSNTALQRCNIYEILLLHSVGNKNIKNQIVKYLRHSIENEKSYLKIYVAIILKIDIESNQKLFKEILNDVITKIDIGKNSDRFENIFRIYGDLCHNGQVNLEGIEAEKISNDYYRFLLKPESFEIADIDPDWIKKLTSISYFKKMASLPAVESLLESILLEKTDKTLRDAYFNIKKYKNVHINLANTSNYIN